jgi:MoaA/NifB/PqqE/SkfB family radical SAM enzyme
MKDFKHFGLKRRFYPDHNYNALWCNLKTVRLGEGKALELPANESEFYDVGINTKCNAECPFCYVSASGQGINYPNICETWKKWMDTFWEKQEDRVLLTNKPFQIAIGSTGEPTIHPEFCYFLRTVYYSGVVPNYTTNGIVLASWDDPMSANYELANEILKYTSKYVGGVAVSFGNKHLRKYAREAVRGLINIGNTNVNIHHIISDKESVDEFVAEWVRYGSDILYHVLLPLMPSGRSSEGVTEGTFEYLEEVIEKNNIKNVAFGAHFIKDLRDSKIKTWLYDEQSFSKNIILTKDLVQITPSSFDLNPIMKIEL